MGKTGIGEEFTLNLNTLHLLTDYIPVYHQEEDTLFIRPVRTVPCVSYDWDGEFWIRVKPDTGEISGIEIENFEKIFMKKEFMKMYPEIRQTWRKIKPLCAQRKSQTCHDDIKPFLRAMTNLISDMVKHNPQ